MSQATQTAGQDSPAQEVGVPELLEKTIQRGASDLHLTTGSHPILRINGSLVRLEEYPTLMPEQLQRMVYAILTQKQRERLEQDLELDMSYSLPGKGRFRVNVYFQRDAIGAAFRMIPFEIRSIDDLGLPKQVEDFARLPRGLVLVTGPTGSGKSTTLASLVDVVNTEKDVHIMTVEDPIEFLHRHKSSVVNQREVGHDTHSFSAALKHVLRQDPDVILVGEMRDLETISTALTAAETGHLVFATLHTQDAPQTIDRIIDVFPPFQQQQVRVQLASSLQGVVTQTLLPRADKKGRVAAAEILVVTPAVRNLIREAKIHQVYTTMQAGGKFGMQSMDQALVDLVRKDLITFETAANNCHSIEELNRMLGRTNIASGAAAATSSALNGGGLNHG
jgi:twitching motility protein PilT